MPHDIPAPFPDLVVPPRSAGQLNKDGLRTREQIELLMEEPASTEQSLSSDDGLDELVTELIKRRARSEPGALRFEPEPTDSETWSLVVPGELLVRTDGQGNVPGDADEVLTRNGFTADPDPNRRAVCPALANRLTVYRYAPLDDKRIDNTRLARKELQAVTKAAPTLVTALHQGPAANPNRRIVVKAAVGPSPTTVEFGAAGEPQPDGKVIVAVIDTGIVRIDDEDNNLVPRTDGLLNEVVRTARSIDPLDAFPAAAPNGLLDFAAGHGTFAAGIVRLVDPTAEIRVYTALDSDGFADENDVACAMIQAVEDGAHVLNLSLGMHTVDNLPSVALELALEMIDEIAEEQGRTPPAIVASAGNYGDSQLVWPAAFTDRVVSVAGLTAEGEGAAWSSHGDWVTCSCVGEGIVSTFVPGTEDDTFSRLRPGLPPADTFPSVDPWAVWTGTSFAAPQIAGAISRLMNEQPGLSPRDAEAELLSRGVPITDYGQALRLLPGTAT